MSEFLHRDGVNMGLLWLVLTVSFALCTSSGRIDRANNPKYHPDQVLLKPATTPPLNKNQQEFQDCSWIIPAKTTLFAADPYPLTPEHLSSYNTFGHIFLRQVFKRSELNTRLATSSETMPTITRGHAMKQCCQHILDSNSIWGTKPQQPHETPSFYRLFNLWRRAPFLRNNIALSPRLGQLAAKLMNVSAVRLYQDSLFFKATTHNVSRWHQDHVATPFKEGTPMITMWMPLESVTKMEMGSLRFASKSHQDGKANKDLYDPMYYGTVPQKVVEERYNITTERYNLGDVSFHHGFTLHGTGPNNSNKSRLALAVQWVPATAVPLNLSHRELRERFKLEQTDDDIDSFSEWVQMKSIYGLRMDHPYFPVVYDNAASDNARTTSKAIENIERFMNGTWTPKQQLHFAHRLCQDNPTFRNFVGDGCNMYGTQGPAHGFCITDGAQAYINCPQSCQVLCQPDPSYSYINDDL